MPISQARQTAATDGRTAAVRKTIEKYLTAVKTWNEAAFRETFHPAANISHYYVKGDAIKTITLDEFVASIESLHRKFDNAEEVAEEIEVTLVGPLASVRVAFAFVMGPNTLRGQDLFNLAYCQGQWRSFTRPITSRWRTMTEHGELVSYEADGGIVTIALNRPDKLNAFDAQLVLALKAALRRFDEDPTALVAVLTGNGRAFSTGADVKARQARSREEFERLGGPQEPEANSADLLNRSVKWKPIIASVHGYVLGLALGIVFECDLVVAEAGTKFQITETSRGLGGARYWALAHFSGGGAFATEVALTGRYFSAEEALAAGMLSRVVAPGTHLEVARELAAQIAANPPLSVRAVVRTRRWFMDRFEREVAALNDAAQLYLTDDFNEAVRAHLEKRPPRPFKGR